VRFFPLACALLLFATPASPEDARRALGPSVLKVPVTQKKSEQGILTPVPIGIELPSDLDARRVLVHYKVFGAERWVTLELTRTGDKYQGAIPCLEVSTITGDIVYYVRVHDAAGQVIAYSGSRHAPYRVRIVHDTARSSETRGGASCPDPSDCPPGLLGCPSAEVERLPCRSDADCEGGMTCGWDGYCEMDPRRANWLSVEVEQQLGLVATTGACSVPSQENEGYACRRDDGATYIGNPIYTNEPLALGWAPTRLVLGYERVVFYDTSVGMKLGYAFMGSGPTPPGGGEFLPFSAELRFVHWFGEDPFARQGLRPYAAIGGGFQMVDIHIAAHVREDVTAPMGIQGGNDLEQTLDVYKRAGDGFVMVGGGLVLAITPGFGLSAELRALEVFPFSAAVLSGTLGARGGF
jgi:hypothetical protein